MDISTDNIIVTRQTLAYKVAMTATSDLRVNPETGGAQRAEKGVDQFLEIYLKVYQGMLAAEHAHQRG